MNESPSSRPDRHGRPRRPSSAPSNSPGGGAAKGGRGARAGGGEHRGGGASTSGRVWKGGSERTAGGTGGRDGGRGGRPSARGDRRGGAERGGRERDRELTEQERIERDLRSVRGRHDDPVIPDEVTPRQLDGGARAELKTLSKENADEVARHLVMAGRLIDDDPELAHQHALSAERRAGRVAVVRETVAITAYAIGDYALALRELRTFRRISGRDDQLPLMVDSERGVGRPERALELGRSVDRATLTPAVQASLAIAMSGARLDLHQPEAALAELEIPQLDPERAFDYSPALFDAYAEVLDELGRADEASAWRDRAQRADEALDAAADVASAETVDVIEEIVEADEG